MKTNTIKRISDILKYLLGGVALVYLLVYLFVALSRMGYPFDLEWMEGGAVDHVRWILAGHALYGKPMLEFVPYAYTPLYYYFSAGVAYVLGVGLTPLRLLSFLASLGCFAIIYLWVRRETSGALSSILAAGMFAATFRLGGAWLDLARVDTLFLLLLLSALYTLRRQWEDAQARLAHSILAGLLIVLAFQAKQTALVVAIPLMAYALLTDARRAWVFIGTVVAGIAGSVLVLNHLCNGWYNYYVFDLPRRHAIVPSMWTGFWTHDIFLALFIVCLVTIAFLVMLALNGFARRFSIADKDTAGLEVSPTGNRVRFWFYLAAFGGMLAASWGSRLSDGGYNNVLLPAYAILSIGFGLGVYSLLEWAARLSPSRQQMASLYLFLLCLIQFFTLRYAPWEQIPTQADLESGHRAVQAIAQLDGDVFIPYHGNLSVMAGKSPHASAMALFDVVGWDRRSDAARSLADEIRQALAERRFGALIVNEPQRWFAEAWSPEVSTYYSEAGRLFDDPTVFWPVTGMRTRPQEIYLTGQR